MPPEKKLKIKKSGSGKSENFRATVREKILIKGTGIHSGGTAVLIIHPAESGSGLNFHVDGNKSNNVAVSPENVINTNQAVTLGNGQDVVQTIEHFLAALSVSGVSDADLELNGNELPIMDGSAWPFYEAIQSVGLSYFSEPMIPIELSSPLWVVERDKYLVLLPETENKITYSIDYDHPLLRNQSFSIGMNSENFAEEILHARTFGFLRDIEAMREKGLIRGASLDNAICLTEDGYMNESLRYENEFIRHKILDLLGDLYLLNRPVHGRIIASRAGHKMDVALALKISKIIGTSPPAETSG